MVSNKLKVGILHSNPLNFGELSRVEHVWATVTYQHELHCFILYFYVDFTDSKYKLLSKIPSG